MIHILNGSIHYLCPDLIKDRYIFISCFILYRGRHIPSALDQACEGSTLSFGYGKLDTVIFVTVEINVRSNEMVPVSDIPDFDTSQSILF